MVHCELEQRFRDSDRRLQAVIVAPRIAHGGGKTVSMRRKLHRLMLAGDMHGLLLSGEHTHHVGPEERSAQVEQNHALHALGHAEKTPLLPAPLPGLDLLSSPQQLVQPLGRMRVLRHGTMHVACALAALL